MYQLLDYYIAEENDVEVFKSKHQHLVYQYVKTIIAQRRNQKNELIIKNIQELKAQGIL